MVKFSVIVPALRETHLALPQACWIDQLIVIESGGSHLDLRNWISDASSLDHEIIEFPLSRAKAMNLGASRAKNEWLLFLHADSTLDLEFESDLVLKDLDVHSAYTFRKAYTGNSVWLKMQAGILNIINGIRPICVTGSNGLLLSKSLFKEIEGFDEKIPFEDLNMFKVLRQSHKLVLLRPFVYTSSRTYDHHGTMRISLAYGISMILFLLNVNRFFIKTFIRQCIRS